MEVKATSVHARREIYEPGNVMEIKIWDIPRSKRYPDGVKFRLFYVEKGEVKVGYDNHHPKGPHRHYLGAEAPYSYNGIDKLVEDFFKDMEVVRRKE